MTATIIPINPDADEPQDMRDARTIVQHLKWFSTDEGKARWLALILSSKRTEIEYCATMTAVRKILRDVP